MNNKELAQKILELSGGEKNITYVTHCATRLRLGVKSEAEVNLKAIGKNNPFFGIENIYRRIRQFYDFEFNDNVCNVFIIR